LFFQPIKPFFPAIRNNATGDFLSGQAEIAPAGMVVLDMFSIGGALVIITLTAAFVTFLCNALNSLAAHTAATGTNGVGVIGSFFTFVMVETPVHFVEK